MDKKESGINEIVDRRMIYYPSFGLYKEVSGFYEYGPIGLKLRRNIERAWRELFVTRLNSLEIETTMVVIEDVLKASGHVSTFTDPIALCSTCKTPYRIDKLLEEYYEKKSDSKGLAQVKKMTLEQMGEKITENGIKCQKCGGKLANIEKFNLMFKTNISQGEVNAYLRPETAQGIFVSFKDLFRSYGLKLPVTICQIGKAFRNEISPRQRLVRMREFTQMETELFMDPDEGQEQFNGIKTDDILTTKVNFIPAGEEKEMQETLGELLKKKMIPNRYFALMMHQEKRLLNHLGIPEDKYRFRQLEKEELPHYSRGNVDLEISTEYGYIEVAGNAYRGDYDLGAHAKASGNDTSVINNEKKVMAHVVEASIGADRLLLSLLSNSVMDDQRGWQWLKLNENTAPYKFAVFPLQKDDKILAKARELYNRLLDAGVPCFYSETASIGKRYAKADEVGIPYCITIDFQTIEDETATIRDRDTTKQERKQLDEIR